MLALAAEDTALCIASEIDRDYTPYFNSSQPWNYHLEWYKNNCAAEKVQAIFPRPMLNSGVWAMRADSPVWEAWRHEFADILQRSAPLGRQNFMADQLSLNLAVYLNGLPLRVMPAEFNWLTLYALPVYDRARALFLRPTAPRTVLSIIHLTHKQKVQELTLATTEGGQIVRRLLRDG